MRLKEHFALHMQIPHKSTPWLEIQDESRWISSKIHMDGKINLDSGTSAAEGDPHDVRKKGHTILIIFVCLSISHTGDYSALFLY